MKSREDTRQIYTVNTSGGFKREKGRSVEITGFGEWKFALVFSLLGGVMGWTVVEVSTGTSVLPKARATKREALHAASSLLHSVVGVPKFRETINRTEKVNDTSKAETFRPNPQIR